MIENELPELEKRVRGLFQSTLDRREPVLTRLPGILGKTNDQGSAEVTGKPGWVWVRIGNDQAVGTAFNNRTSKRNGLPVIVGHDPAQPTLFQVLSTREVYQDAMAASGSLPAHHQQHEFGNTDGGEDLVYLRMRQMVDLMVYPTDPESLEVNVADGHYVIGATVYHYAGGTLDLTSYVPAASKKWVLIACDDTGPYIVDGTQGYYSYADIPDANDAAHYKLAGVLLKAGDTAITDWPNEARFVDLRLVGARSSSSGGYTDWTGCRIVAKGGGNYNTIQSALTGAGSGVQIIILPGTWAENINTSTGTQVIAGFIDQQNTPAYGVILTGADDTGPMAILDTYCVFANLVMNRTLTSGAGAYYGIDAYYATSYRHFKGLHVIVYSGASGRDVYALRMASLVSATTITLCDFVTDNPGAGGATVEIGAGDSEMRYCSLYDTNGNVALRITGTGTHVIEQTDIDGNVEITGTSTVYFRNCRITGDFTIAGSGATVYTRNVYIGGDISIGASDTWNPYMTNQAASKTVSNSGTIIGTWFFVDETTYTDHFWGPVGNNQATYSRLYPTGTVSGMNRAALGVFFTDYLNDATDYEQVELVALDDGADVAGVLRTMAGGTGTLRNLWLGVGGTKANYVRIDSSGNVTIPGALTLPNTGLHLLDTNASHDLIIAPGSDLTADHTLTLTTGDADRTITLSGNPTLNDWFDQSVKAAASPIFAGVTLGNTGLHVLDTNASHDLIIAPGSDLTADHTLTLTTGDADRTVTLNGNPTLDDWFDQSVKAAASPTFAAVTLGNTGLHILDTNASHDLIIAPGSDLTADHTLTLTTGDADRTLTLSGNLTVELASLVNQDLTTDANVNFAQVTLPDSGKLILGTGGDGELYSSSDDLYIANVAQDKDILFQVNDGGVTVTPIRIYGDTGNVGIGQASSNAATLEIMKSDGAGLGGTLRVSNNAYTGDGGATTEIFFTGNVASRKSNILATVRGDVGKADRISLGVVNDSGSYLENLTLYYTGQVGIAQTAPAISDGYGLHIGGKIIRMDTSKTPASAGATGYVGEICWDSSYLYVCIASNTWRRIAHATW